MAIAQELAARPRIRYDGVKNLVINRVACEALGSRYVSMSMEGEEVVLRARRSLSLGGDVLCGTLTPIGQGRAVIRIGFLIRKYSLPQKGTFSVLPTVVPGEVRFRWSV